MYSASLNNSSGTPSMQGLTGSFAPEPPQALAPPCDAFDKLSPEQYRAIRHLLLRLEKDDGPLPQLGFSGGVQFSPGFFTFYTKERKLRDLPSADGWRWNQSKGPVQVTLPGGIDFHLIKLSPRRMGSSQSRSSLPVGKLWKYAIKKPGSKRIFALWCEAFDNQRTPMNSRRNPAPYEVPSHDTWQLPDNSTPSRAPASLRLGEQVTLVPSSLFPDSDPERDEAYRPNRYGPFS